MRIDLDWSRAHPDAGLFLATSTGLASGNAREEALCHAIFEVIERDAEWRWDRLTGRPAGAPESIADSVETPMLRRLLDQFAAAGICGLHVGHDVGCRHSRLLLLDRDTNPFGAIRIFGGTGCHLSKEIALSRALTEAAQSRLTFIAGSRDDLFPDLYEPAQDDTRRRRNRPGARLRDAQVAAASVRRSPKIWPPRSTFSAPRDSRA